MWIHCRHRTYARFIIIILLQLFLNIDAMETGMETGRVSSRQGWNPFRRRKNTYLTSNKDHEIQSFYIDDCLTTDLNEATKKDADSVENNEEEHPLRTDEWLVKIKAVGLFPKSVKKNIEMFPRTPMDCISVSNVNGSLRPIKKTCRRESEQILRFSRNGYVMLVQKYAKDTTVTDQDNSVRTAVGKWKLDHTGLSWHMDVALPIDDSGKSTNFASSFRGFDSRSNTHDENAAISVATTDQTKRSFPSFADISMGGGAQATPQSQPQPCRGRSSWCNLERVGSGGSRTAFAHGSPLRWRTTTLHYRADIHLNKFGERPRMFKGVVTRDRFLSIGAKTGKNSNPQKFLGLHLPPKASLFRPVVATFEADGIGEDTADTRYRTRGFALETSNERRQKKVS